MPPTDEEVQEIIDSIDCHLSDGLCAVHGLKYLLSIRGAMDNEVMMSLLINHYHSLLETSVQGIYAILQTFGGGS